MTNPLSRRRFLTLGAAVTAAAGLPPLATAAIVGSDNETVRRRTLAALGEATTGAGIAPDRILVALHLDGGNDGLHTVVPIADPGYAELRRGHLLEQSALNRLDDAYALHAMPGLADRWAAGHLAVVHGVGYDPANLSHFTSSDIWHRGDVDPGVSSGWLGRTLRALPESGDHALLGISVGGSNPALRAPGLATVAVSPAERLPWSPRDRAEVGSLATAFDQLSTSTSSDTTLASAVRAGHSQALMVGERIGPISDAALEAAEAQELASEALDVDDEAEEALVGAEHLDQELSLVADLINAGVPTKAYSVTQGGYDTHGEQFWSHPILLRGLDRALEAFRTRLGDNADRVVVMIWSEFGRRPYFNGNGTDHGTASVALVLGAQIRGGHYGEQPSLRRFDTNNNFVPTVDFRSLLGGVAETVLGVPADLTTPGVAPLLL